MSDTTAVLVSFRLGDVDGVSVEARKWEWALRELGFSTRRVAGEFGDGLRPDDTWIPFLAIDPVGGARPEPDVLAASLAGADLVVAENICSLPLNEAASSLTAHVLAEHEGRVVFHHHDLPWERERFAHIKAFPPRRPESLHVTINERARLQLAERGIDAQLVRNAFDLHPPEGDRAGTRAARGFDADDLVVLQPTRAIPRKRIDRGLELARLLHVELPEQVIRYWLTGPAEDGFDAELARLVAGAAVPVSTGRAPRPEDAYAAADLVVLPSSWEGFGNPVVEATVAGKPVAVAQYPVLDELLALGLHLLSIEDPAAVAEALRAPDPALAAANLACLHEHLDLADLPRRLAAAFAQVGWDEW